MEKYTKLQKIGQGSFGSAFLCVKTLEPHGRKYVIKEIRMDPRDQHTALREAKLLAALDHPNIIACRESFLALPTTLCIVTEFADGGDLRKQLTDRAARRTPFHETELLDLFLQCCLALKHLHDRKIIHRDIKPENIFLTSSHVVKLGDFGVATVLSHTLACAQTLTGTPYYTSPEICLGSKYNSKTDIWSLGCVLYELATFTHAFNGRSQRQLFENIIAAKYPPVSTALYSPRLVALLCEMLQKNPRDRPSVNQLIRRPVLMERIQSFLSQRGVADALAHTVLHGQHIFQRPGGVEKKSVSPVKRAPQVVAARAPRAVQYEPPMSRKKPEPSVAAAGRPRSSGGGPVVRRNSLKSSGSRRKILRKLASPVKPSQAKKKPDEVLTPPPPSSKPSPAGRPIQRQIHQPKEEPAAAVAKRPSRVVPKDKPTPTRAKQQEQKPTGKAAADPLASSVSDRVSRFNAQWQAQRRQILGKLPAADRAGVPLPPPPPVQKKNDDKDGDVSPESAPPPPPAPLLAAGGVMQRGQKPSSAAALAAAKQREAMRRDIHDKKLKRASVASASPLDDPVILVQNLPDYQKSRGVPKKLTSAVVTPPPAPVAVTREEKEEREEEEEEDIQTPDATVVEKANLEFQRMLLQLQSVVEEPNHGDQDEEEEEEGREVVVSASGSGTESDKTEELRGTTSLPPPPFDVAVEKGINLSTQALENPRFKATLRAKLRGGDLAETEELPETQAKALAWLHNYIRELL